MPSKKPFYITTTLPYVNSDPHIGFAMEIVRADAIARYHNSLNEEVFFNTGTDEHGVKIFEEATLAGKTPQEYVDIYSAKFSELIEALNLSISSFVRTTDEKHIEAAKKFWKLCDETGDIYKKQYKVKYCNGCELEKTDSELVDGKCPLHTNLEIEIREEENYFFKYSKYQDKLMSLYKEHPDFITPQFRFNETLKWTERGLEDFSISRLKSKMPWGIPVPGDETQVMYVWFDALVSYISAIGWPHDKDTFEKWWNQSGGVIQYCGKDNNRQQSSMWQAMLISAGLNPSKKIIINGFINGVDGRKMSKSLGNVINPYEVVELFKPFTDFPEDVLRFFLLQLPSFEDTNIDITSIKDIYSAYLANGIGNLTNRIMKLAETYKVTLSEEYKWSETYKDDDLYKQYIQNLNAYDIKKAVEAITQTTQKMDEYMQTNEPFKVIKVDEARGKEMIYKLVRNLWEVAIMLEPIIPRTAEKIKETISVNKMPEKPLFARL
ncbi:MAG: metG [Candidatus Nomurabacteria bacterium]|nr:metG [Candidatus Nomurabacteria bacterium]